MVPMTARECFGVGVRLLGIVFLAVSVLYAYSTVVVLVEPRPQDSGVSNYIGMTIICFVAGLYCLRGAPQLSKFAYPDKPVSD
jgi:hypothetical protein